MFSPGHFTTFVYLSRLSRVRKQYFFILNPPRKRQNIKKPHAHPKLFATRPSTSRQGSSMSQQSGPRGNLFRLSQWAELFCTVERWPGLRTPSKTWKYPSWANRRAGRTYCTPWLCHRRESYKKGRFAHRRRREVRCHSRPRLTFQTDPVDYIQGRHSSRCSRRQIGIPSIASPMKTPCKASLIVNLSKLTKPDVNASIIWFCATATILGCPTLCSENTTGKMGQAPHAWNGLCTRYGTTTEKNGLQKPMFAIDTPALSPSLVVS